MEYREFPISAMLRKWDEILTQTAEFMASFAFWNSTTGVYDVGQPMYPVSENTAPNSTFNPTFKLAYWRFGLHIAVVGNLAPLTVFNETYTVRLLMKEGAITYLVNENLRLMM